MSETLNEAALRIAREEGLFNDELRTNKENEKFLRVTRRLAAWMAEGQEPLRVALEAEKACEEAFAIRIMGQEAYDNSPCQAHPLELVERWLTEQEPCGYFQMHNGSYEQVGLSYRKDPDVFPLYRHPAPKEVEKEESMAIDYRLCGYGLPDVFGYLAGYAHSKVGEGWVPVFFRKTRKGR